MNIRASVELRQKGNAKAFLDRIAKQLAQARNAEVKVGFPAGDAPDSIIAIAVYNHEGTKGGGWGGPIPPRPFITRAMHQGRGELRSVMRAQARGILTGRFTVPQCLEQLGQWGQGAIQDQIASNMAPANSPVTVSLKGSSHTLIDTGRLRGSVTYQVKI